MSNPNPFVPKGSLLERQTQSRSRLKLGVSCVLAVSIVGLVAMLIQGCKRAPDADTTNSGTLTDTNPVPADISTNPVADTNAPVPPTGTNAPIAYTAPVPPPAPVPVPTPVVDNTAAGSEYVVQSGDTLGKIAKHNGISLKALEAANPGVDSKHLKVKQKLVIPGGTGGSTSTGGGAVDTSAGAGDSSDVELYTVKTGDTLNKIARTHGSTIKAIEAANNLSTTKINVGKKLKIPRKASAAAAPAAPVDNTPPASTVPSAPVNVPPSAPSPSPAPAGNPN
jgi:LysM repeat protein